MNKNKLIVFSAPSGAGKTTLVKHILSQFSNTNFSISATFPFFKPVEKIEHFA